MNEEYYELLVLAARYAFAALGVLILWRAFRWLRQDSRRRKKMMSALPDAGYVGTLHVMAGESKSMRPGDGFQLPMEGVLGSGAGCDVRIPHSTVGGRHALFEFRDDGLHLRPYRDERLQVDGQPVPAGCEAILQHGAVLALGGVMLQLRLFAGIYVPVAIQAEAAAPTRARKGRGASTPEGFPPPPVSSRPAGGRREAPYDQPYEKESARGKRGRDVTMDTDDNPVNGRRRGR